MLIIQVKEGEPIDRALKRYKKKFEKVKILQELRERQRFVKPSVRRRNEILKAIHRERMKRLNS